MPMRESVVRLCVVAALLAPLTAVSAPPPASVGVPRGDQVEVSSAPPKTRKQARVERILRYANYLAMVERDYEAAARELSKSLKVDRRNHKAARQLAGIYIQTKRWDQARRALRTAITDTSDLHEWTDRHMDK